VDIDLKKLRILVANAAREELLPRFNRVARGEKADGSVVTEADLATQQYLQDALMADYPEAAFLGEEMPSVEQEKMLQSEQPLWCLDPLDGTRNFVSGIPHFAISLALLHKQRVELGIVYDPVRDECFTALKGQGAWLNDQHIEKQLIDIRLDQSTALIDFKCLPTDLSARLVQEHPYASQRSFGSAALDWCWLAMGRCHVYLHGRSNIWDYAAGHLVFQEAGGYSITLQGDALFTYALTPRAAVAALDKNMFDAWTEWVGIKAN
jgi:myo-inositol-1(or 4)-monophosphatase